MYVRAILALILPALVGNLTLANDDKPKVGDRVIVVMQGDLARDYGRREEVALPKGSDNLEISTVAMVVGRRTADKVTLEVTSFSKREGRKDRLITMTTTVDVSGLSVQITPKGTATYPSPADHQAGAKPTLTESEQKTYVVKLSSLSGVKMQTWELAE